MLENLSLIQLSQAEIELAEMLETEEITKEQFEAMQKEINENLQVKSLNYIKVNDMLSNNLEQGKLYLKEIQKRIKRIENAQKKLKDFLVFAMEKSGLKRIDTHLGTITFNKGKDSIVITNENLIPNEFIKEEIVRKVDKVAIKEHLKNTGEIVTGADIETKPYVTFK